MANSIKTTALTALFGVMLATSACSKTPPVTASHLPQELQQDASEACSVFAARARSTAEKDHELVLHLASACGAVLIDFDVSGNIDKASIFHGKAFLESFVELHQETEALIAARKDAGFGGRIYPTRTGEFLMARHLGVLDHFSEWRRSYLARFPS